MEKRRLQLSDFSTEKVLVPDFVPGSFGMDTVVRGCMDDKEWKRWLAISKVNEIKQLMVKYRREKGSKGLRDAIIKFLTDNDITAEES
jgi:hypothetical protein